nr:NADP-dependent phosphogluconate dehydrogenase [uncultured Shimia sp.]
MKQANIGVYGLGTMGSALALNFAEHGFDVAVSNREVDWIPDFVREAGSLGSHIVPCETLESLVGSLAIPRVILFMIPSGKPMDQMIEKVLPLLDQGDTIIDAGNADFNATRRRFTDLQVKDIHYVGMGVSGGEKGARHGPSMMVGGTTHSWQQLKPMAQAIAAKFEGTPCVAHLGPDGAGHFVKTVHNGIEYADMQMIAEIYGVLRDGAGWSAQDIGTMFAEWNKGPLQSYLIEASAEVLHAVDPETGQAMVDVIQDQAGQKGTGRWTVIEALKLGQSASGIEAAVGARSWSADKGARELAQSILSGGTLAQDVPDQGTLAAAFEAARILAHAQGFAVMQAASEEYDWALDLAEIAKIWRAGCIIRSELLDDLAEVLGQKMPAGSLVLSDKLQPRLDTGIPALRKVVGAAVMAGWPVPALSAVLGWYDSLRCGRGTTNLIQAQRDFFGAHGFERVDAQGRHHGPWGTSET